MDQYNLSNLLGHFVAIGADIAFHEPINPREANVHMCSEAARELGYEEVVTAFQELQDHRT
jgi:hypothetical protein